jgi:signal peptidase I
MADPPVGIPRFLRPWVERLVLLLVAGLLLQTWYCQGLIIPCQITGGSMAEGLLGVHREVVCADCGHRFVCGTESQPISGRAVCPNCGYAGNDLGRQPDLSGDRVLIHKAMFRLRPPRRWEVVAFASPHDSSKLAVKRAVGLPGEAVQILNGDVYVNGQIQRKTLRQQRALAVLVYDACCQPTLPPVLPPRWQNQEKGGRWGFSGGRCAHAAADDPGPIDWLTYSHWRRAAGEPGEVCAEPVADQCSYNQTSPRRVEDIHPVTDLMLSLRLVRTAGPGWLVVRATDGREEFQVWIEPEQNRYETLHNGKAIPSGRGALPRKTVGMLLELSLFDRQFLLAFDGRTVVTRPYDRSPDPPTPTCRPFGIGSRGLEVVLEDLRVYRDVYYTHPIGLDGRSGLQSIAHLGDSEYFVLGDNSPISEDSRTWPEGPAVAGKLLVGKPLLVVFPARRLDLGEWGIEVPDLQTIRYIR